MVKRQDASTGKIVDDGQPAATPKDAPTPTMHVKVYSPFQTYFDDEAESISGINDTGPFDILPEHQSFLTLLNAGDLVIRTPRGKRTINITKGLMHVKADQVIVFLDV